MANKKTRCHHNGDQTSRWFHILCSISSHKFGDLEDLSDCSSQYLFRASQCVLSYLCSINSFCWSLTIWPKNWKDLGTPQFGWLGGKQELGTSPWVPISSTLTCMVSFTMLNYLQRQLFVSIHTPARLTRTWWQLLCWRLSLCCAAKL